MIGPFIGEYRFLSNFYEASFVYEGVKYKTAEHAFQATKAMTEEEKMYVKNARTPSEAKRRGREVFLRLGWDRHREKVMFEIVLQKFMQNEEIGTRLIETGEEYLAEINTWNDLFWGIDRYGRGENKLGEILMRVRTKIKIQRVGK